VAVALDFAVAAGVAGSSASRDARLAAGAAGIGSRLAVLAICTNKKEISEVLIEG
jgi:hypothetical protein